MRAGVAGAGWASWLPSRRLRPFSARFGLAGYVVAAPRRQAWRARWARLGRRGLAGGAALLALLLLAWGLGLFVAAAAAGGAGAWEARRRAKAAAKARRDSARSPWPCNGSWQRGAPSRDEPSAFGWDGSPGLLGRSSSLTVACSPSSFQNSFCQSSMPSSAFGRSLLGRSSSSLATFPPDLMGELATPPSRIGWRGRRGLLADFNAVMAERHREAGTSSADSRLRLLGRPPSFPFGGPRATFTPDRVGEAATPPAWIDRVLKDFSPAVAERRREAGSSPADSRPRRLFRHSPSSPAVLDQWPSRLVLTPAEGPAPDPCARETVVKALREKEKARKRKAEQVDLQQDPINGKDKRRRRESGGSVPSALEPPLSNGAPASFAAEPGSPDAPAGLRDASSSSSSSSKRNRRYSSSLSSSSTESVSYGIPSICKAKRRKATPENTPGQESWSKEPWCWDCSHMEESGPRRTSKPLNVDKAVQVEMDDAETPRQEAPGLQASSLRPNGPKRRSICLVRINPDEPLDLPPELQALSEAMKVRAKAEKAARLQQRVRQASDDQMGPLSSSLSEAAASSTSSLSPVPPTASSHTVVDSNALEDRQAGERWSTGRERWGGDAEARTTLPDGSAKETPPPLLCLAQGPAPMPVVFGSGAPLSRGESLPPVTEMEVTEAAPAGPSASTSSSAAAPPLPSPSTTQTDGGGGFLAKTPTKRSSSSSSSVLHPTALATPSAPSKRQALADGEAPATASGTAAPVFRPVFGLSGAGSAPLVTPPYAAPPATFPPVFGGTRASATVASAAASPLPFQPASGNNNNDDTAANAISTAASALSATGVFTAAPASALSLLSGVATPPLPSQGPMHRPQAASATSQPSVSQPPTAMMASSTAAIGSSLFGGLPPPPRTAAAGQLTASNGGPHAAASPALGPLGLGSPFGYAAFGPSSSSSSVRSGGASQPAYSLPGPSGSFRFGAATTTASGGAALGGQAGPAPAAGATAGPLLPPLMNPAGSAGQASASPSGSLAFSIPGAAQTQLAFAGGAASGSGPSAVGGVPAPANSLPSFAGSPLTFSIGAGAKSGARQRLQARRQHPRRK